MTDQFDSNVAGKKPKTRETKVVVPKRPWDVPNPPVAEEPVAVRTSATAPQATHQRERVEERPQQHQQPQGEVLVASDDTLMIDNENLDIFGEIKQLEAQMVSTLSMKSGLEEEMEKAQHHLESLREEAEEIEGRIDTLRTQEELERQLGTVQSQRDSAMDRLGEVEARLESTVASRAAIQADLENSRHSLEEALEENGNLGQRIEETTARVRELERDGARAQAENERLRERVRQLEIVKETQESNLNAARAAMKNIKQRLAESNVRARLHR